MRIKCFIIISWYVKPWNLVYFSFTITAQRSSFNVFLKDEESKAPPSFRLSPRITSNIWITNTKSDRESLRSVSIQRQWYTTKSPKRKSPKVPLTLQLHCCFLTWYPSNCATSHRRTQLTAVRKRHADIAFFNYAPTTQKFGKGTNSKKRHVDM